MKLRAVSVERIGRVAVVLTCGAVVVSVLTGVGDPQGVAAGGAVMVLNYHLIRTLVSRLITPRGSRLPAIGALVLKFGLMGVLVLGLFYRFPVEPMSFAFGASLLSVAAVLDATLLGRPIPPAAADQ
jgi:hypothetical protein